MDREAFKLRMQALKSYQEQNPGKGYLDWKASLPDNLQDESNYNLLRAYELGYEPETVEGDSLKHLPTRDLETGEILKKPWHPTFLIGLQEDAKLGYYPLTIDGTTYTTTWEGNENPIYKYADGGEIPPEPIPYKGKLYKDRYGRKYTENQLADYYDNSSDEIDRFTGKPLVIGLKPLLDIEDAANATPVGDALSVYDAYGAARNKDWSGMGLALLPLLPFVPRVKGAVKKAEKQMSRTVPTVNRSYVEKQLDRAIELKNKPETDFHIEDIADGRNARNRVIEDIDSDAIKRAREVDAQYGTNYEKAYQDLIDTYNNDYYNLTEVEYNHDIERARPGAQAKITLDGDADIDFAVHGIKPTKASDYVIQLNPHSRDVTKPVMQHEMSHLADRMASKVGGIDQPNIFPNNKMLETLSKNSNFLDYDYFAKNNKRMTKDQYDNYLHMGTEIKSFMNATRRALFETGRIKRLTSEIDLDTVKDYMKTLDSNKSEKNLFNSFKKPNEYLKWINSIPVLGVGTMGMYGSMSDE